MIGEDASVKSAWIGGDGGDYDFIWHLKLDKTEERLLICSGATLKDTYVAKNVAIRP